MTEQDSSQRKEANSGADQTLLGVAPPRVDSSADMQRAPVFVRSGTSSADLESAPASRLAPQSVAPPRVAGGASEIPVAIAAQGGTSGIGGVSVRLLGVARRRPVLWMVLTPLLVASFALLLGHHGHARSAVAQASIAPPPGYVDPLASAKADDAKAEGVKAASATPAGLAALEAKPPESLNAHELVLLADAHADGQRAAAVALRQKIESTPTLAKDSAVQSELMHLASDPRSAPEALGAMAALAPPMGADLLYEIWTGTPQRSDTTDLARALVYSADVRASASPALAVALGLRAAETCEQYKALLPEALKDGDHRSLHLLTKLNAKRGCGAKKAADCFACLREPKDDLTATINAVKSRRAPSYAAQ